MYPSEKFYRSILYFTSTIIPSGITVVDGQEYGIRVDDPEGQSPSIAITIGDVTNADLELGSFGTNYPVYFTINAQSRLQRDALKDIVRSGIHYNLIPIYSQFTQSSQTPASGAVIEQYAELGNYYQARDMPNFSDAREKFYWNSVITVALNILGL